MTFDNRRSRDAEERLDEVWDDVIRSGAEGSPSRNGDDAVTAAFASYLNQLAPTLEPSARERMRARVLATPRGGRSTMDSHAASAPNGGERIARLPQQPRPAARRRGGLLHHPVMQIAATLLLMLGLIGSWLVIRGTSDPDRSTSQFAAGSPSPGQTNSGEGGSGRDLISLDIDRYGEDQTLYATMRRVTLEPGALWDFDNGAFGLGSNLAGRYLESGSVTVGGPDSEVVIGAGERIDAVTEMSRGFQNFIRNGGREPAVIIDLYVHKAGEGVPQPPMGSAVELIGYAPFEQPAGTITRLDLMRMTVNGEGAPAVPISRPGETIFVAVESGEMDVQWREDMGYSIADPTTSFSAPGPWTLRDGDTVYGRDLSDAVTVAGSEPLTTLALNMEHASGQNVAQDRVFSEPVQWERPETAEQVILSLREIRLEPGSEWTRDYDGVVHLWVRSGELTLSFETGEAPESVTAGATVSESDDGPVTLSSEGSEAVELIEGVFIEGQEDAMLYPEIPDGVAFDELATGIVALGGTVETALYTELVQQNSGSSYVQGGALLASVIEGPLLFSGLGGEIDILHGMTGALERLETLGEPITLENSDGFLVHPGSGYGLDSESEGTAVVVVLGIWPIGNDDQPSASPTADPDLSTARDQVINVAPGDCTIEPRSIAEFEAILADPFADGTPQAGMREQAATGVPADQETIKGVTDTVRQIVACNAPGSHLEMYSLYSASMLRFHAAAGNLTIDDISGLDQLEPSASTPPVSGYVAVEDVVIFPDGRAGAMVNANGEIAYLTFVYEDGRWLIDFWDDQIPEAEATPAA